MEISEQQFSSTKIREYFISTKEQLEEQAENLQEQLLDTKEENKRLRLQNEIQKITMMTNDIGSTIEKIEKIDKWDFELLADDE